MRFGRLVVVRFLERRRKESYWICQCDCGNTSEIPGGNLGRTTNSCGCYRREAQSAKTKKHGMDGTKEYRAWAAMKGRCLNSSHKSFPNYGGRGISVCAQWIDSFETFYRDMGQSKPGDSIERKDSNGNYEPANCLWIPIALQSRNRRGVRLYDFHSESLTIAEIATKIGIPRNTAAYHIERGRSASWISSRFATR